MRDTRMIRIRLIALVLALILSGAGTSRHAVLHADDQDEPDDAHVAVPRPYEREEFPQWAWDLRRGEIIAFGAYPIAMIVSGISLQLGRFVLASIQDGQFSQEYAPFFLSTRIGPRYDEQERVSAFVDATTSRLNERAFELMTESGDSSIRLLQNAHSETSNHDQALALGLELTRLFLRQRGGTGAYRVHGGGFAGTMLVVVPESLFEEYRTAMGRAFGEEAVVPLQIRQDGLVAARLEPVEPLEP